jgi:hypothetical protein
MIWRSRNVSDRVPHQAEIDRRGRRLEIGRREHYTMGENSKSYRFSLRDLFLFTLACSLLLFEWKMWGVASLLGTLTTLVCGAAFVWFFAARPIKNSRRVTIACVLFSLGNFALFPIFIFIAFHFISLFSWGSKGQLNFFNGLGIAFFGLLCTTVIAAWMLRLMIEPKWSLWFPFLIALNLWSGMILIGVMTDNDDNHIGQTFGADVLRGYATAMALFAIAIVLRWVKSLPTTRDDLAP